MPRHSSVQHLVDMLDPNPNLPEGPARTIAELTAKYRDDVLERIGDGPETSAGLRHLLEAKDCLVRQAVEIQLRVLAAEARMLGLA